jgi:hypothetical protein
MRSVAVLLLAVIPAIANAQVRPGGGGFGRGRGPGRPAHEEGITAPKQVNAVNLLIQHRQELSLTDTQFVQIIVIKRVVDSANAPFMRKIDSVQRVFKSVPIFSEPSAAHRDSVAEGRAVVQEALAGVRENLDTARDKAYALLSSQQLAKAQELEAQAQKAIDDEARRRK